MRMPPNENGHGGSQRAWHLLHALLPHGDVHFVLMYRAQDKDCISASLEPLRPFVASITRIEIAGWQATWVRRYKVIPAGIWNLFKMRSQEAPHLSAAELESVAARLPIRDPDVIFAGRLCVAVILESVRRRGLLASQLRVVDFDDIMSKFYRRQSRSLQTQQALKKRLLGRLDSAIVARSEAAISRSWHGVSVCTDEDVAGLSRDRRVKTAMKIPNAVRRELLPLRPRDGSFKVLFVGNLNFFPNIDGLRVFAESAWPRLRRAVPEAQVVVVGLNPAQMVLELVQRHGFELQANAPSLQPFYLDCDAVIAPILFGSGTRIKILEAMAYGRAVVSTTAGADGLGLEHRKHLLLADTMDDFADALIALARDPGLTQSLVDQANDFQRINYTPDAVDSTVAAFIAAGYTNAGKERLLDRNVRA